jgi:hypothetical protein
VPYFFWTVLQPWSLHPLELHLVVVGTGWSVRTDNGHKVVDLDDIERSVVVNLPLGGCFTVE